MESVIVISGTVQEFLGERFYLCGNYFQHKGKRLHRVVWEHSNGAIPKGYHVHHKDADRTNNNLDNLELIDGKEHMNMHAKTNARRENGRKAIKHAIDKAPEWHHSEAGKEWHSKHAIEYWNKAPFNTYICTHCGREYQSRAVRYMGNHFCSNNCKAAYGRRKRKSENNKD